MGRYILGRLASLALVLLGVSTLAFVLGTLAPGDPAEIFLERALGRPPTEAQISEQRRAMGLDGPLPLRFGRWLARAAAGDLGESWGAGRAVTAVLADALPHTTLLAVAALALSLVIALPLAVASAARPRGSADRLSRTVAVLGASLPTFFVGYLLMWVFGVRLGLLPIFGTGSLSHVVLPAATLSLATTGVFTRVMRAGMLAALDEEYVRAAFARGLSRAHVLVRHVLRNTVMPLLAVAGVAFGQLLGGAVVVEWIFSWPGLGKVGVDAIYNRDYPLIQGWMIVAGLVALVANLAADLGGAWADPRVRVRRD